MDSFTDMTSKELHESVKTFFEDFNEAFGSFSGGKIAERYAAPYLAIRAGGTTEAFPTFESIGTYFQVLLDDYHARGCRLCKYKDLEVVGIGKSAALGTVTWELCDADGTLVTTWRESYNLVLVEGRMRAAASHDHA